MTSPAEPSEIRSAAEAAFARFLALRIAGEPANWETFREAHLELAEDLDRLHAAWMTQREVRPPTVYTQLSAKVTETTGSSPASTQLDPIDRTGATEPVSPPGDAPKPTGDKQIRYRIDGEIARGGMGAILKVFDTDLGRPLAMKVVLSRFGGTEGPADRELLGRFLEEAQITGQLEHPGIVPVHELGIDSDGRVYFTMRLVKGQDFETIVDQARAERDGWTRTRALNSLLKVCETMAYAHAKGVVHRDLKPANVMVGRFGETYVMDWGIARVVGRDLERPSIPETGSTIIEIQPPKRVESGGLDTPAHVTLEGAVIGTPCYMSPEQAAGMLDAIGPRSDVYSVGCMLYRLLTGYSPYLGDEDTQNASDVLRRLRTQPPRPIRELDPSVPEELIAICDKAMERRPQDRYPTMLEMAEDLRAYLERRVVHAYETGALAEFRKWVVRNKGTAAAVAALVLLSIAALFAFGWLERNRASAIAAEQAKTRSEHEEAVRNLDRAQRESYVANIIAADTSLRTNEVREARRHLLACLPEGLRGWEWRHLFLASDQSLRTFEGHRETVTSVAVDPDVTRVLSTDENGEVRLWDASTGQCVHTLTEHKSRVVYATFRRHGTQIVSVGGSTDATVRVWDAESGAPLSEVGLAHGADHTAVLRPDGAAVALGTAEHAIHVVDVDSGQPLGRFEGHTGAIRALDFTPDGSRLLSGSDDLTVRTWRMGSPEPVATLASEHGEVLAAAFAPDGGIVAGTSEGALLFADAAATAWTHTLESAHDRPVSAVAFDADGTRVASASFDRTVVVWDVETRRGVAAPLRGHGDPVRAVAFAGDGARLVTGSEDKTVRLWEVGENPAVDVRRGDDEGHFTAVAAARARTLIAVGSWPGALRVIDLETDRTLFAAEELEGEVTSVAFDRDGRHVAAALDEVAVVRVWDLESSERIAELEGHELSVRSIAFGPGAGSLVSGSEDGTVRVWDLAGAGAASPRVLGDRTGLDGAQVECIAVDGDGRRIAVGTHEGRVQIVDAASWAVARSWSAHPGGAVRTLTFSPDGALLATGGDDARIAVWDTATGERVSVLVGHGQHVSSVTFDPGGERLVSGSFDHTVRVWSVRLSGPDEGRPLLTLRGHDGPVSSVAFGGDGSRVVSVSFDNTLRVWRSHRR